MVTGVGAGLPTITYTSANGCTATTGIVVTACGTGRSANGAAANPSVALGNIYTLYPNPSNGLLNIEQSIAVDQTSAVRVMNYAGQTTFAGNISFTGGKAQLELGNVAQGIYLVEMREEQGVVTTFRVVVQK